MWKRRRAASRVAEQAGNKRRDKPRVTRTRAQQAVAAQSEPAAETSVNPCKHRKRSKWGVCLKCGHLEKPERTKAVTQSHTDVFELDTYADVLAFAHQLLNTKKLAPKSLHYTVAITATRNVVLRGSGNGNRRDITRIS